MAFELDKAGGAEVLKVMAAEAIGALAQQVAAAAGEGAVVEMSTTDRARAKVKVPADVQAKDGVLTRAAAEVGLEVRPSKKRPPRNKSSKKPRVPRKRGRPRKSAPNE